MSSILILALAPWVAASSPWSVTATPPVAQERARTALVCTDGGVRPVWEPAAKATIAPVAGATLPNAPTTADPASTNDVRPAKLDHGWSAKTHYAVGGTLLAAGTAMRMFTPMYIDVADGRDGPMPQIRMGMSSASHSSRELGVGIAGTLLQAVGATIVQLGAKKDRGP